MMPGPRRELAIVHGPQFPAHCLGRDDDVERLKYLLAEVDKPPTHHAMNGRDRATSSTMRARAARCSLVRRGV